MTTQENNKLISEFMGFTLDTPPNIGGAVWYDNEEVYLHISSEFKHSNCFKELQFHTSWDWLMPVVEKIEDFFIIDNKNLEFQLVSYEDEIKIVAKHPDKKWEVIIEVDADGSGKRENTYKAVVEFIKYYNQLN